MVRIDMGFDEWFNGCSVVTDSDGDLMFKTPKRGMGIVLDVFEIRIFEENRFLFSIQCIDAGSKAYNNPMDNPLLGGVLFELCDAIDEGM